MNSIEDLPRTKRKAESPAISEQLMEEVTLSVECCQVRPHPLALEVKNFFNRAAFSPTLRAYGFIRSER